MLVKQSYSSHMLMVHANQEKNGQNLVWWMMVDPIALLTLMSQYCWRLQRLQVIHLSLRLGAWKSLLASLYQLQQDQEDSAETHQGACEWCKKALRISRVSHWTWGFQDFPQGLSKRVGKWIMTWSSLNQVSAVGAKACRPPEEMQTNTIGIPWPDKTSAIVKPCFSASRPYGQSEVCTGNISTYTHIM